jgi:hypothetical protein
MPKIWTKGGKIITKNGMIVLCDECPCKKPPGDCFPRVLAQKALYGQHMFWAIPESAKKVTPGSAHKWRIVEVKTADATVGSYILHSGGSVNDEGVLVGLTDYSSNKYTYNIVARLEVGCINEKGVTIWPTQR